MRNEILFTLSKFYLYCLDPFVTWVCLKIPKCVKTSAECRFYGETCEFYIGLADYYGGKEEVARWYLQQVTEQGKNEHYIQAAQSILEKLPPPRK